MDPTTSTFILRRSPRRAHTLIHPTTTPSSLPARYFGPDSDDAEDPDNAPNQTATSEFQSLKATYNIEQSYLLDELPSFDKQMRGECNSSVLGTPKVVFGGGMPPSKEDSSLGSSTSPIKFKFTFGKPLPKPPQQPPTATSHPPSTSLTSIPWPPPSQIQRIGIIHLDPHTQVNASSQERNSVSLAALNDDPTLIATEQLPSKQEHVTNSIPPSMKHFIGKNFAPLPIRRNLVSGTRVLRPQAAGEKNGIIEDLGRSLHATNGPAKQAPLRLDGDPTNVMHQATDSPSTDNGASDSPETAGALPAACSLPSSIPSQPNLRRTNDEVRKIFPVRQQLNSNPRKSVPVFPADSSDTLPQTTLALLAHSAVLSAEDESSARASQTISALPKDEALAALGTPEGNVGADYGNCGDASGELTSAVMCSPILDSTATEASPADSSGSTSQEASHQEEQTDFRASGTVKPLPAKIGIVAQPSKNNVFTRQTRSRDQTGLLKPHTTSRKSGPEVPEADEKVADPRRIVPPRSKRMSPNSSISPPPNAAAHSLLLSDQVVYVLPNLDIETSSCNEESKPIEASVYVAPAPPDHASETSPTASLETRPSTETRADPSFEFPGAFPPKDLEDKIVPPVTKEARANRASPLAKDSVGDNPVDEEPQEVKGEGGSHQEQPAGKPVSRVLSQRVDPSISKLETGAPKVVKPSTQEGKKLTRVSKGGVPKQQTKSGILTDNIQSRATQKPPRPAPADKPAKQRNTVPQATRSLKVKSNTSTSQSIPPSQAGRTFAEPKPLATSEHADPIPSNAEVENSMAPSPSSPSPPAETLVGANEKADQDGPPVISADDAEEVELQYELLSTSGPLPGKLDGPIADPTTSNSAKEPLALAAEDPVQHNLLSQDASPVNPLSAQLIGSTHPRETDKPKVESIPVVPASSSTDRTPVPHPRQSINPSHHMQPILTHPSAPRLTTSSRSSRKRPAEDKADLGNGENGPEVRNEPSTSKRTEDERRPKKAKLEHRPPPVRRRVPPTAPAKKSSRSAPPGPPPTHRKTRSSVAISSVRPLASAYMSTDNTRGVNTTRKPLAAVDIESRAKDPPTRTTKHNAPPDEPARTAQPSRNAENHPAVIKPQTSHLVLKHAPTIAHSPKLSTFKRAKERAVFEERIREKEAELERLKELQRIETEALELEHWKDDRKRIDELTKMRARPIPEFYQEIKAELGVLRAQAGGLVPTEERDDD